MLKEVEEIGGGEQQVDKGAVREIRFLYQGSLRKGIKRVI